MFASFNEYEWLRLLAGDGAPCSDCTGLIRILIQIRTSILAAMLPRRWTCCPPCGPTFFGSWPALITHGLENGV